VNAAVRRFVVSGLDRYPGSIATALQDAGAEILDATLDRALLVAATDEWARRARAAYPLLVIAPERML